MIFSREQCHLVSCPHSVTHDCQLGISVTESEAQDEASVEPEFHVGPQLGGTDQAQRHASKLGAKEELLVRVV